jgi:PST family polysaccharide transporter
VNLIKVGLISSINVGTKLLCGIFINKILAIYIGPSGYVIFGQFQSIVSALTTLAGAGIGNGITKYTSEYNNEPNKQKQIWAVSVFIVIISTILSIILLIFIENIGGNKLLKNENFQNIILILIISIPFYSINMILLSILNGKKDVTTYTYCGILANIISAIGIGTSAWLWSLKGALASAVISQVVICMVTIKICSTKIWFNFKIFQPKYDQTIVKLLMQFTAMIGITAILSPITLIIVRMNIIEEFGLNAAGCWEGINRLSNMYLMFVITPLSIYFIPKISELENNYNLKLEILNTSKIIIPITIIMSVVIYFSREIIIKILFTDEFREMSKLFMWQMIGDIFKISAWILSFYLVAKKITVIFILTEIFFSLNLIILTNALSKISNFEGTSMAYALNNLIALSILIFIVSRRLNRN